MNDVDAFGGHANVLDQISPRGFADPITRRAVR